MTDPETADVTYIEPVTPGDRRQDPGARAARRAPADHGRADRAQRRHGAGARRHARAAGGRADRRLARGDRQGRGPRPVPRGHAQDRAGPAQEPRRALGRGRARGAGRDWAAGDHPALVHTGRHRRGHRLQPRGVRADRGLRPRRLADRRSADRPVGAGLEGVRDGGGPRPGGQLHHRLLDREHRPHGRAHRRQHHRGAGADLDRQGISADAQRLDRGPARDRGGYRRLERPVRARSGDGPDGRDRDEPARVAQLGPGVEGDRASRSPRSPPSSPSATRWTRSRTTSPAPRRPPSSRRSTTSSPRSRASPSRSSPRPSPCSPPP